MKKLLISILLLIILISFVNAVENYETLKLINVTQIGYSAEALRIDNNILYILVWGGSKLITYDISNSYNPIHLQTFNTCDGQDLFVKNNLVYIACYDDSKLSILNATNSSNMNEINSITLTDLNGASDVFVDDNNIAYVVSQSGIGSLISFNVSNNNIILLDEINSTEIPNFYGVSVIGKDDIIYVGTDWQGESIIAFNVSDPYNIFNISTTSGQGNPYYLYHISGLEVFNDYLFYSSFYDNAFGILDISNPYDMQFISAVSGGGEPNYLGGLWGIDYNNNRIYTAPSGENGLSIYDITNISNPLYLYNISKRNDCGTSEPYSKYYMCGVWDIDFDDNFIYYISEYDYSFGIVQDNCITNYELIYNLTDCLINDTKIKTNFYKDFNCDELDIIDNYEEITCDFCYPNSVCLEYEKECNTTYLQNCLILNDTNNCFSQTNLQSDNVSNLVLTRSCVGAYQPEDLPKVIVDNIGSFFKSLKDNIGLIILGLVAVIITIIFIKIKMR